jgi:hypothetical protein
MHARIDAAVGPVLGCNFPLNRFDLQSRVDVSRFSSSLPSRAVLMTTGALCSPGDV